MSRGRRTGGARPDEPWKEVSGARLAQEIDRCLEPVATDDLGKGRVLRPAVAVSLTSALMGCMATGEDRDRLSESVETCGIGDAVAHLVRADWVLRCEVLDSMVSGEWGLRSFRLGDRGYLHVSPDFGVGADESLRIAGAWEPWRSGTARRRCIERVFLAEWSAEEWLPYVAGCQARDRVALEQLVRQVLGAGVSSPWLWGGLLKTLKRGLSRSSPDASALERSSSLELDHVAQVTSQVLSGDEELRARFARGALTPGELSAVVALVIDGIVEIEAPRTPAARNTRWGRPGLGSPSVPSSEPTPAVGPPDFVRLLSGPWIVYECGADGMANEQPSDWLDLAEDGSFAMRPLPVGIRPFRGTWSVGRGKNGWPRIRFAAATGPLAELYVVLARTGDGEPPFMNWQRTRGGAVIFEDRVARCHRPEGWEPDGAGGRGG